MQNKKPANSGQHISELYLNTRPLAQLRRRSMMVTILAIASAGAFLLVRSHAVTPVATLEPESGNLSNSVTRIMDATASTGSAVKFTDSQAAADLSGQVLPGAIASYTRVCGENFSKAAALGSWAATSATQVVYSNGCNWYVYPDGWPSTLTNGNPGYAPAQVLSVHDGVLDFYLHPINGHAQGANPSPLLSNTGTVYQHYGKYIVRMRIDKTAGYHDAFLLWPENDADWQFAESDFPETDLDSSDVSAFAHYGGAGAQDAFNRAIDLTQWHTYEQDWTPTSRSYYIDGQLLGTSTRTTYSGPQRFQLQTEPLGLAAGGTGHQLVDWVAVYAPN